MFDPPISAHESNRPVHLNAVESLLKARGYSSTRCKTPGNQAKPRMNIMNLNLMSSDLHND